MQSSDHISRYKRWSEYLPTWAAITFCLWISSALPATGETSTRHQLHPPRHVLILNSHDYGMPWQQTVNQSIESTLESAEGDIKTVLHFEFTGLSQNDEEIYARQLKEIYHTKYGNSGLDLIIAVDTPAISFMTVHGQTLFPGLPVVFITDSDSLDHRRLKSNMTGLLSTIDAKGSLETALRLHPETKHIAIISGAAKFDRQLETRVREELKNFQDRFDFIYLSQLPMDELLSRVERLPANTIVLYVLTLVDGSGRQFIPKKILPEISKAANAPVYGFYDVLLGAGIVGGHLSSAEIEGRKAAQTALLIFNGTPPNKIPVIQGAHVYMFDWRQLERWNIDEKNLPPGSVIKHKNQSLWTLYRWQIIWILVLFTLQGALIMYLLALRSKQHLTEQELKTAHERFLKILDSIDTTVYVADIQTYKILFMNKFMSKSFGKDMTGEICWKAFRNMDGPCPHCTNDALISKDGHPAGPIVWEDENPITKKWYINYDRSIIWTDGRLVRLQVATDITELKQMEKALRHTHKKEAISTIIGGIAHDFNNLLGIMIGNTELAMDDILEFHPTRDNLDEVFTAGLKAKEVIRQLLHFVQKHEPVKEQTDLTLLVHGMIQEMRQITPETIDIQSDISLDPCSVMADTSQIRQMIRHLWKNAVQAMEINGGVLKIHLEKTSQKKPVNDILLTISDTGSGIDPDIKSRIFDPYFTTREIGDGSGMGLAVVYGIVKNHLGTVNVESEPEQGTTVTVQFPLIDAAPET